MKELTAAGPWMADYGRIYKNDDGDEAVCCGFSSGLGHTTTRLKTLKDGKTLECRFVFSSRPWEEDCDWYAVDLWLTREEQLALHVKF